MPKVTVKVPPEVQELPLRLELAMRAAHINQTELAKRSTVAQSAISRLLSERQTGGLLAHLVILAKALDVRLAWLAVGEEPMRPPGSRGALVLDADAAVERSPDVRVRTKHKKR